jgi:hypothetical protein
MAALPLAETLAASTKVPLVLIQIGDVAVLVPVSVFASGSVFAKHQ